MRSPLLLIFTVAASLVLGQHCGYDNASIIVVRPHQVGDSLVEAHLRITLLDTNNLPLVFNGYAWNRFRRNEVRNLPHDRTWQWHFQLHQGAVFPFAADNYVLIVPTRADYSGYSILVQDERKIDRKGLKQTVVPITTNDVYPLCGVYDNDVYPTLEGRPLFAPIDIPLQPLR
jgi:hypothetical protein